MKPVLRNNISRVVVKMHSDALLISVLLLMGLISIGYTAPPGKPVISDGHNTSSASFGSGSVNQTPSPIERLQQACSTANGKEPGKDCIAYNHLASVMKEPKIWNNDTEQVFSQELSRTLSSQQFLCTNLTAVVKKIPKELMSDSLKPFEHWKECVMLCSEGDDDTWKDSCRVLLAGYSALVHSIEKPVIEAKQTQQHPSAEVSEAAKVQPGSVSILPSKAANGDTSVGKEQITKDIPESDTNLRSDAKSHEDVSGNVGTIINSPAVTPEKPKIVEVSAQGVKKEEKIEKQPPPPFPQIDQGSMDKNMNSADAEQDGLDDDPTDGKGATNNFDDYREDSEESDARVPQETINDTPNAADKHEQPMENEQLPQKVRPQDEQDEFAGSSRNSDIVQGSDPFYNQNDSNFFSYFLFAMFSCAILYVAYHNKSKLMALVVEGRRTNNGRGGFSKGRKHTAAYRKLDSNLEEAITSGSASGGHSSSQIIY